MWPYLENLLKEKRHDVVQFIDRHKTELFLQQNTYQRGTLRRRKNKRKVRPQKSFDIMYYLNGYLEKTKKERIQLNLNILISFLIILIISYMLVSEMFCFYLIALILYSSYFLLHALYLFSTIINEDNETDSSINPFTQIGKGIFSGEQNSYAYSFLSGTQASMAFPHMHSLKDLSVCTHQEEEEEEVEETPGYIKLNLSNEKEENANYNEELVETENQNDYIYQDHSNYNEYNRNNTKKENTISYKKNKLVDEYNNTFVNDSKEEEIYVYKEVEECENNSNINIQLKKAQSKVWKSYQATEKENHIQIEKDIPSKINESNIIDSLDSNNNNTMYYDETYEKQTYHNEFIEKKENQTFHMEQQKIEDDEISLHVVADSIKQGAEGFMNVQYKYIFRVTFIFAILILLLYVFKGDTILLPNGYATSNNSKEFIRIFPFAYGLLTCISFTLGSFCSSLVGYCGIFVSVRVNVKVAKAAKKSYNHSLVTCFRGGAISALVNVGLANIGICFLLLLVRIMYPFLCLSKYPLLIVGYGFGASVVAMMAQLGGGIYTKAADIGADFSGKIEKNIPEDDVRNPAVIADLVGDNVGDCAGQCSDLFESICTEMIASMILGGTLSKHEMGFNQTNQYIILFPIFIHSLDLLISTIGMYFVKDDNLKRVRFQYGNMPGLEPRNPMKALLKGYAVTCVGGMIGFVYLCKLFFYNDKNPFIWIQMSMCGLIGMGCSYAFVMVTRYYTDHTFSKVKSIARASINGAATNIITGLSVGLESTFFPILVISISLLASYYLGMKSDFTNDGNSLNGLYGTSVATMGMLSTAVFILSMSNFGPIADNAGGIVEMSGQGPSIRSITDSLDTVGNVTKANTKGYAIGSAALASFLMFSAFLDEVKAHSNGTIININIAIPEVFIGGLFGAVVVFLFAGFAMDAVMKTTQEVLKEVRRQFKERPKIMLNQEKPDYHKCVSIISKKSLVEGIKPALLGIITPVLLGLIFKELGKLQNNQYLGAQALAAFIMFSTATGILMALFLNNAGGAWDNAKKYIESGSLGIYHGKGTDTHKNSVIGDMVGDPCKDTAGPSIHVLIKLISTITMVITPAIISKV